MSFSVSNTTLPVWEYIFSKSHLTHMLQMWHVFDGKTVVNTIVQVELRWYEPTSCEVWVNDCVTNDSKLL